MAIIEISQGILRAFLAFPMTSSPPLVRRYTANALLQLRARVTAAPPAKVKRRLWFWGILCSARYNEHVTSATNSDNQDSQPAQLEPRGSSSSPDLTPRNAHAPKVPPPAKFPCSMRSLSRLHYSREQLTSLRQDFPISRQQRRCLWYRHLLRPRDSPLIASSPSLIDSPQTTSAVSTASCTLHNIASQHSASQPVLQSNSQTFPIPVRITKRCHGKKEFLAQRNPVLSPSRHLISIPVSQSEGSVTKLQLKRRPSPQPSCLLSNVRSLSNKFDEISSKVRKLRPDFAVFTETWLSEDIPDNSISITGYSTVRCDRNNHGGGIICYLSEHYDFCKYGPADLPCLSNCDSEFLIILIRPSILLICVYHAFWSSRLRDDDCITCITDIIDHVSINSTIEPWKLQIIVCGDFNHLHTRYSDISRMTGLTALVESPTRGSNILDQIFSNVKTTKPPSLLPPFGKSDHSVILWRPSQPHHPPTIIKVKTHNMSERNKVKFHNLITSVDWTALVSSQSDLEQSSSLLLDSLSHAYNDCFPQRVVRMRSDDPPWMKPALKSLINVRDRAWHSRQYGKYNRLRNEVIQLTRKLKSDFLSSSAASKDAKQIWESVRLVSRYAKRSNSRTDFDCELLNQYFASNFQADENHYSVPDAHPSQDSIIVSVSVTEVQKHLDQLKKKSCGPDGIPFWVWKNYSSFLAPAVTHIFNRSLAEAWIPTCFKQADISPIPKRSKATEVSHYRPISLLPIIAKVLEKVILHKCILPYIYNVLDRSQFAYIPRSGSGTTTALTLINHRITSFLDSAPGAVRIMTADFSKAFDRLSHSSIIDAVQRFNLPITTIKWIHNYLNDRYQRVRFNGETSTWTRTTSGVPQGSVLGPILFCIATDSLKACLKNTSVIKYADDVTFLHFVRQVSEDHLQDEWDNLVNWSKNNSLPLNISKCRLMDVITKKDLTLSPIKCSNAENLEQTSSLELLGVTFSSNMKWDAHIQKQLNKARKRIFIIRNLRRSNCPPHLMFQTYTALIRSLLLYAYPSMCNMPIRLTSYINRFERRCFRIIGIGDNAFPTFHSAADNICTKLLRDVEANSDHPLRELFTKSTHSRTRSYSHPLRRPFAKTKRLSTSFVKFCAC